MAVEPRIRTCRYTSVGLVLGILIVIILSPTISVAESVIRSGSEVDYPPFCIVHDDGRAGGFSVELMRAALKAVGREVTFRTGPWSEVRGWLEQGEVDALPLVGRTPERERLFDFTVPYMIMHGAIVVRDDTTGVQTLSDLRGRRVAVMKADTAEEFLRRRDRGFDIVETPTFPAALDLLVAGECDAVFMQRLLAVRLLAGKGFEHLRIVEQPVEGFAQDFCFAVREGDADMLALLNEGLALVTADGTRRRLQSRWFSDPHLPQDRSIIIGGDSKDPPFEFLDKKGRPAGYNVDMIRAVAEALGLDIRIRLGPWPDIMDALSRGDIDAVEGMSYSEQRDRNFDFSPAHIVNHYVGVIREGEGSPPETLADLKDKRIVVQSGNIAHDFLVANGMVSQLTAVDSPEHALRELHAGKHDCVLVSRMSALYWIRKEGWDDLVVSRTPLLSPDYCFAVPNGSSVLLTELSEGLAAIAASGEYHRIHEKWMGVYGGHFLWNDILRYVAMVAVPLIVVVLLVLLWSWMLRKQVAQRTEELRRSETKYGLYVSTAVNGIFVSDTEGRYLEVNPGACRMTGYSESELLNMCIPDIAPADSRDAARAHFSTVRETGTSSGVGPFRRKDGSCGWWSVEAVRLSDDRILAITTDLTRQREHETRIEHLVQVLRAIRNVNQLIVVERNPEVLAREACKLLVETRGYRRACITLQDGMGKPWFLGAVGWNGESDSVNDFLAEGRLPACAGHASATKRGLAVLSATRDCGDCPFRCLGDDATAVCTVLRHEDRTFGFLSITYPEDVDIDAEEESLLFEIAGDLGLALHIIEMEEVRRRSEELLEETGEIARVGGWEINPEDNTIIWTKEIEAILETSVDHVPELDAALDRFFPAVRDEVAEAIQRTKETGIPFDLELPFVTAKGRDLWVRVVGEAETEDGRCVRLHGTFQDISDYRRARDALRESQARFKAVIETIPDLVWLKDPEGTYLACNLRFEALYGTSEADIVGKTDYDFVSTEQADFFRANDRKAVECGQPTSNEEWVTFASDGHRELLETIKTPMLDTDGKLAGVLGIGRDITARKEAEEALRVSKKKLEEAQAVARIGSWEYDIATDRMVWSAEMFHFFQIDPSRGEPSWEEHRRLIHPEDWDRLDTTVRRAISDGYPYDEECRIILPDGSERWAHVLGRGVRDDDGRVVRLVGTVQDITDHKAAEKTQADAEARLRQSERLEAIGTLAGGVAHDFNNLLMGIMNYVELCRDGLGDNHPIREWLDEITADAQRSANLTRQLLAFARKQTIAPRVLDLNATVAGMLKLLRRLIGEDIELIWEPGASLCQVRFDPSQVDQLLANLCINARDAIGGVGKITIETEMVTLDDDYCASHADAVPGRYVMLAVSDSGCGMDRETLEHAFEPFFTTKGLGGGTGLGLATVHGIVKQNGGHINAYSEPGHGTTFRLYLPCFRDESVIGRPDETGIEEISLRGNGTILLVEDEKSVRLTTAIFLKNLGYTVLSAECPAEALALVADHHDDIDLLITDVVMPGMSGRDLADCLVKEYPDVKCLYMSGYTANVIAHRGVLEKGVEFLAKPFTRDALAHRVWEILNA